MFNPEEDKEDIPKTDVNVADRKIKLGKKWYDLILCYLCPHCGEPIIAYWKVTDKEHRVEADVVGRALRDSGFGGYRFFESSGGQGFEYDAERDPRKRHLHEKASQYSYHSEPEILWQPFIKLNPTFSVNEFFHKTLSPMGGEYALDHKFVLDQKAAMALIEKMRNYVDTFRVVDDICKHGKPLFFFNLVIWARKTRYSYRADDRMKEMHEWFGELLDNPKFNFEKEVHGEE